MDFNKTLSKLLGKEVKLANDIIDGTASFNITLNIIWVFDAPNDFAASITPESTYFKDDSIILATNGAAAIVNGTISAASPIGVPTIALVNGIINTIKIINGKLLNTFIIKSNTLYIILFGFNPFGDVTVTTIPSINPNILANNVEKNTI